MLSFSHTFSKVDFGGIESLFILRNMNLNEDSLENIENAYRDKDNNDRIHLLHTKIQALDEIIAFQDYELSSVLNKNVNNIEKENEIGRQLELLGRWRTKHVTSIVEQKLRDGEYRNEILRQQFTVSG